MDWNQFKKIIRTWDDSVLERLLNALNELKNNSEETYMQNPSMSQLIKESTSKCTKDNLKQLVDKNLQQLLSKIRTEGLNNYMVSKLWLEELPGTICKTLEVSSMLLIFIFDDIRRSLYWKTQQTKHHIKAK